MMLRWSDLFLFRLPDQYSPNIQLQIHLKITRKHVHHVMRMVALHFFCGYAKVINNPTALGLVCLRI